MPELPEVETVVRGLRAAGLEGARIRDVLVHWPKTVAGATPAAFVRAMCGCRVRRLTRRAKYIVAELDNRQHLLVHLRMTGQFRIEPSGAKPDTHDRLVLLLADGRQVHFHDTRKFGRFQLVDDPHQHLAAIGPEPLSGAFTPDVLRLRLAGTRRKIKPLLLDQTCVAGIGNIYADESLWQARIHPARRADTLTPPEIQRLHHAIRTVLAKAVAAEGTTLGDGATNFYSVAGRRGRNADALQVFRRTGAPCPRCSRAIVRLVVGGRGTHICPHCQRAKGEDQTATRQTYTTRTRKA
ncbi:MAG: bifunctional DNA-formamidopyrimidine glycosylase/DNA-(apurinic or apyrimidinic site) lyase [bacterium]